MKIIDIHPDLLNKELVRKICKNKKLKRDYIRKYDLLIGGNIEDPLDKLKTVMYPSMHELIFNEFKNIIKYYLGYLFDDFKNELKNIHKDNNEEIKTLFREYLMKINSDVVFNMFSRDTEPYKTQHNKIVEKIVETKNDKLIPFIRHMFYPLHINIDDINKYIEDPEIDLEQINKFFNSFHYDYNADQSLKKLRIQNIYKTIVKPFLNLKDGGNGTILFDIIDILKYITDPEQQYSLVISDFDSYKNKLDIQLQTNLMTDIETLNIGIEIETCKKDINSKLNLEHFEQEEDGSIKCTGSDKKERDKRGIEYVLKGYKLDTEISVLNEEITRIIDASDITCRNYSCGLHYHISSDSIKFNKYGLVFLINFMINWIDLYQDECINEFNYKRNIKDLTKYNIIRDKPETKLRWSSSDAKPNENLSKKERNNLNTIKKQLISDIHENVFNSWHDKPLEEVYNNIIDNLPLQRNRPYLTIVEDFEYIHFEFRGLLPDKIIETNQTFIAHVKQLFRDIAFITSFELNIDDSNQNERLLNQIPSNYINIVSSF